MALPPYLRRLENQFLKWVLFVDFRPERHQKTSHTSASCHKTEATAFVTWITQKSASNNKMKREDVDFQYKIIRQVKGNKRVGFSPNINERHFSLPTQRP